MFFRPEDKWKREGVATALRLGGRLNALNFVDREAHIDTRSAGLAVEDHFGPGRPHGIEPDVRGVRVGLGAVREADGPSDAVVGHGRERSEKGNITDPNDSGEIRRRSERS